VSARIVQFGTSRFLQAHVDLFVHEAREDGQDAGPITVVKTTRSTERAGRVAAFAAGYPVIVRGIEDGHAVERRLMVTSVDAGLSAVDDWEALVAVFVGQAGFVVSNTGDSGYTIDPADRHLSLFGAAGAPQSFPAILLKLLWLRWRDGGAPFTILPCELIHRNGTALRGIITGLAREVGATAAFVDWLGACIWADTLVDRIVSAPIEPIGAVAEPYALWAIGAQPGLVLPWTHPAVVMTDDLEPYERLKLHILNLGHTVLAQSWLDDGAREGMTVRAMMAGEAGARMEALLRTEVVPGFAAKALGEQADAYLATTLDRFRNPHLDHLLCDIAQHHAQKIERRIEAFFAWTGNVTPQLAAIVERNRVSSDQDGTDRVTPATLRA
jgi:tagaturonate reductase